jgi:hypothetical protein
MGWNDHLDSSELSNLPEAAWNNPFDIDGSFDPNDDRLAEKDRENQVVAVREWFLSRFCDPAIETPYSGGEGGYLFVNGGPFDPADEIRERFSSVVPEDIIKEIVDEMHAEVGDQWAPIRKQFQDEYDIRFALDVEVSGKPLRTLLERVEQAQKLLTLQGDDSAMNLAKRLVFGSVISTLEAFLWETADYWVEKNEHVLQECITKLPHFRDEKIKLGDIFTRQLTFRSDVKGYLQNLVWHSWDKVRPLYKLGLGIDLPSTKPFEDAMIKRHDIVHRSGHDKDGVPIDVTESEITDLCIAVREFAKKIEASLASKN